MNIDDSVFEVWHSENLDKCVDALHNIPSGYFANDVKVQFLNGEYVVTVIAVHIAEEGE